MESTWSPHPAFFVTVLWKCAPERSDRADTQGTYDFHNIRRDTVATFEQRVKAVSGPLHQKGLYTELNNITVNVLYRDRVHYLPHTILRFEGRATNALAVTGRRARAES